MAGIRHNHALDGKLHGRCPGCDFIRSKRVRDKAHKEAEQDLKAIAKKAPKKRLRP